MRTVVAKLKEWLYSQEDHEGFVTGVTTATVLFDSKAARQRIQTSLNQLLSYVDVTTFDIRLVQACDSAVFIKWNMQFISSCFLPLFTVTCSAEIGSCKTLLKTKK